MPINTIIDIYYQNDIDLPRVQQAGIEAIIHKASEGMTFRDPDYAARKAAALQMGFLWGAYHFSGGGDVRRQVRNFLAVENGSNPAVLMALDWEDSSTGANMTLAQARDFVTRIHDATGRWPAVYGGHLIRENVPADRRDAVLANCPLWYVRYAPTPIGIPTATWPTYTLWQYTDGQVGNQPRTTPGAPGADRNQFLGTTAQLRSAWPFSRVTGITPQLAAARGAAEGGHLRVLSETQIRAAFGDFRHREDPRKRGAIIIAPPWAADNIVTVDIPQLRGLPHYGNGGFSGRFSCHTLVAARLRDAFADIERAGLRDLLLFWGGCWVPRHKSWDPSRSLSSHSWGIAVDINVQWNGYGARPAPRGQRGSVVDLVPIFERHGFAWGGYFSTPDGMHFEYCRTT